MPANISYNPTLNLSAPRSQTAGLAPNTNSNQRLNQTQRQVAPQPRTDGTSGAIRGTSSKQKLHNVAPTKSGSSSKGKKAAVVSPEDQIKELVRQARKIQSDTNISSASRHEAILETYSNIIKINPYQPSGWINLANELLPRETILINGMNFDQKQCLINFLDSFDTAKIANPQKFAGVYSLIAQKMLPAELSLIHGQHLSRTQIMSLALKLDSNPAMFVEAGKMLDSGETIEYNGEQLDKIGCFMKSIELNPNHHPALFEISLILDHDQSLAINGEVKNKMNCILSAIQLAPREARGYYLLSQAMMEKGVTSVNNQNLHYFRNKALECLNQKQEPLSQIEFEMLDNLQRQNAASLPALIQRQEDSTALQGLVLPRIF